MTPERRPVSGAKQVARRREVALQEGDAAPIELTRLFGGRLFAFEHTGIEPFERQIELEAKAHFQPLRTMFSGKIPQGRGLTEQAARG